MRTMLTFANVLELFPHELARLRRRGLSLLAIPARALDRFWIRHRSLLSPDREGKTPASHGLPFRRPARPRRLALAAALVLLAAGAGRLEAAMSVALDASPASPVPVGDVVVWTSAVSGGSDDLWYRFRLREPGGDVRMIRDFGPTSTLEWTSLEEGSYIFEVTVRDRSTNQTTATTSTIQMISRIDAGSAVSPTVQPLIYLFSHAGCETGLARVRFQSEGGPVRYSPTKPCEAGRSVNFYLAGLTPNTTYTASFVREDGLSVSSEPELPFTTGDAVYAIPLPTVVQPVAPESAEQFLLQTPLFLPPFATDVAGNLVWVGPAELSFVTRPLGNGEFLGIVESRVDTRQDLLRRFDLTGRTIRETNAARVNEQLAALGRRPITGFHHEAREIRGGKTLVLGGVERILTDVQGPGPVNVLGDMILVLDEDFQVIWTWDSFDHLDTSRAALLGETCLKFPGCPPYYGGADANDWTHSNSVAETADGALILSVRHQDWVLKIDYQEGHGSGAILWRLGHDGDFTIESDDPFPWFSHQHDVSFEVADATRLDLFDNGNTRRVQDPEALSRGQVLVLDEKNRTAQIALNTPLGDFSMALGSAQRLANGNYHFDVGFITNPQSPRGQSSHAVEVTPSGDGASLLSLDAAVYRSFRMVDLYGSSAAPARAVPAVPPEGPPEATRVVEFRP